jgi:hypothetical protein
MYDEHDYRNEMLDVDCTTLGVAIKLRVVERDHWDCLIEVLLGNLQLNESYAQRLIFRSLKSSLTNFKESKEEEVGEGVDELFGSLEDWEFVQPKGEKKSEDNREEGV